MAFEDEEVAIACLKQLLGSAMAVGRRIPGRVELVGWELAAANDPDGLEPDVAGHSQSANSTAKCAGLAASFALSGSAIGGLLGGWCETALGWLRLS